MRLRPYSAMPGRLALQIVADLFVLAWVYLWYRLGTAVHDALTAAASVGYRIQDSAGGVAGSLNQAGRNADSLPLVGQSLSEPLRTAAGQIGGIAGSGRDLGDRLTTAATPAGLLVALAPILVVLAFWLPARLRFARRAGEAAELAGAYAGEELLALRALTNRPLHELRRVAPDPLVAWRSGDPAAVRALAALELRSSGVVAAGARPLPPAGVEPERAALLDEGGGRGDGAPAP
jgi:hypothetical protein